MAEGQASIEHLKDVLRKTTLKIARVGGVDAHEIADRMVERFASEPHPSQEGAELSKKFVETFVKSVCAEEELRQHFKEHPDERNHYETFWNSVQT
jgi:hypothetical protein